MPPDGFEVANSAMEMVSKPLKSRRQGISLRTIKPYQGYLKHAVNVVGISDTRVA